MIGRGKQKLFFNLIHYFNIVPSFDSNIQFVNFCAEGACARVYFLATYFLYNIFIARIA